MSGFRDFPFLGSFSPLLPPTSFPEGSQTLPNPWPLKAGEVTSVLHPSSQLVYFLLDSLSFLFSLCSLGLWIQHGRRYSPLLSLMSPPNIGTGIGIGMKWAVHFHVRIFRFRVRDGTPEPIRQLMHQTLPVWMSASLVQAHCIRVSTHCIIRWSWSCNGVSVLGIRWGWSCIGVGMLDIRWCWSCEHISFRDGWWLVIRRWNVKLCSLAGRCTRAP